MTPSALDGLKIIELASFVSGPYCGKLLGDMGAEVIKIEPPLVGDAARNRGPFPGSLPHPEKSGLFLYLNTNKLGITLDVADPAGHDVLRALLTDADVLIHDKPPSEAKALAIDYPSLRDHYPRLIVTAVTPFGSSGPYAEYKAHHLNLFHAGGEGYTIPGGLGYELFPDRPPLKLGGHTGDYDGGTAAAVGAMAAVLARERWGVGQFVDVSRQEANLALNRVTFVTEESEGIVTRRGNRTYKFGGVYPAKDGYVVIRPTEDRQWQALTGLLGQPALAEDPRFKERPARMEHGLELNAAVSQWSRHRTKQEIFDSCLKAGVPAALVATAKDIVDSPQIQHRGFFQEVSHPQAGTLPYASTPYQFQQSPRRAARPAPLLGQHNHEVLVGRLGLAGEELAVLRANGVI